MGFWWVNHKQTAREERGGNYIWAPKLNMAGRRSWSWDNLPRTRLGDIVFSYAQTKIGAVGIVVEECQERRRPDEFGKVGDAWDKQGWAVGVEWQMLAAPVFPKLHMDEIAPLLRPKYSPIKTDGNGNMGCYLAQISDELGLTLLRLADELEITLKRADDVKGEAEAVRQEQQLMCDQTIPETERAQLIKARRGQGRFRTNVESVEKACRLTGLKEKQFLIASHIKPWQVSSNYERLDGNNGLLLSPHIDKLFDKGWISFSDDGKVLVPDHGLTNILTAWRVDPSYNVGTFNPIQRNYLEYHRDVIFGRK